MTAWLSRQWARCRNYVDALSLRERVLLTVTATVIVLGGGELFVLAPMVERFEHRAQAIVMKQQEIDAMRSVIGDLVARYRRDSDAANRARLAELRTALSETDAPLTRLTAGMVAPEEMAKLVEDVLLSNQHLDLVQMQNLAPEELLQTHAESAPPEGATDQTRPALSQTADIALYKHGLELSVKGRYAELVRFLRTLEALPWKVAWGKVRLEAYEYPLSKLVLVVYTFSLEEAWLQV